MTKQTGTFNKGQNNGTAKCGDCGKTFQKGNMERVDNGTTGYTCNRCWDMAGDDNSVADGNMTCADFKARWGEHSDYCDCSVEAMVEDFQTAAAEGKVTFVEALIADAKANPEKHECLCGCKGTPKGKRSMFLPGHDAKYHAANARRAALGLCRID